jgi:chitinase
VANYLDCPIPEQYDAYTHIVIAFAVSYVYVNESFNNCSQTCEISLGDDNDVCNNTQNQELIERLQAADKKVIVSFGGAGMGLRQGANNKCWEFCFGKEPEVVDQLVSIVNSMGLDGVDIDYEYFLEDGFYNTTDPGAGNFTKSAEAQKFLTDVTVGLKQNLPPGSIVTHAPMDADTVKDEPYYNILVNVSSSLDFVMIQYYNSITQPVTDGVNGTGNGMRTAALQHYTNLTNGVFGGDPTKVVFGFCIVNCRYATRFVTIICAFMICPCLRCSNQNSVMC